MQVGRVVVDGRRRFQKAGDLLEIDRGKAALTELFQGVRTEKTPIIVERIVNDIDWIVRQVRFEGWQNTAGGERTGRQALRRTLLKYQLHKDQDLFDRA